MLWYFLNHRAFGRKNGSRMRYRLLVGIVIACLGVGWAEQARAYDLDLALWKMFQAQVNSSTSGALTFNREYLRYQLSAEDIPQIMLYFPNETTNLRHQRLYTWDAGKGGYWNEANQELLTLVGNQHGFRTFAEQFGYMLAPKFLAPAETLGHAGFDIGLIYNFNIIGNKRKLWGDALEGFDARDGATGKPDHPPQAWQTISFNLRKGLPYSLELGADGTYLFQSKMFLLGLNAKWAFFEGYSYAPAFAIRFTYNHLFGSSDLTMNLYTLDLSTSYPVPFAGFVEFTPYMGYSFSIADAMPHVLNPSFHRGVGAEMGPSILFDDEQLYLHRFFLGFRFIIHVVNFSFETIISGKGVYSCGLKLGVDF